VMNFFGDGQATQVLNSPSDGSERSVGVNLALFALPNGDYNLNGGYDAADYVNWRKSIGGDTAYAAWREKFGGSSADSAGLAQDSSVPEPTATALTSICLFASLTLCRAKRDFGKSSKKFRAARRVESNAVGVFT